MGHCVVHDTPGDKSTHYFRLAPFWRGQEAGRRAHRSWRDGRVHGVTWAVFLLKPAAFVLSGGHAATASRDQERERRERGPPPASRRALKNIPEVKVWGRAAEVSWGMSLAPASRGALENLAGPWPVPSKYNGSRYVNPFALVGLSGHSFARHETRALHVEV